MKKVYLSLIAAGLAFSSMAQLNTNVESAPRGKDLSGEIFTQRTTVVESGNRDVIWSNTFNEPTDWVQGNEGTHPDLAWQIGADAELTGPFLPDGLLVNSPSVDDGVALIDSDAYGSDASTLTENQWFQNAEPIDLTGVDHATLRFYTSYLMWDGGGSDGNEFLLVELSHDGTTWPDITTYEVADADPGMRYELFPDMSTQDLVDNPTMFNFNISEGAANQDSLYVRFRWVGVWGYAWTLDDVSICQEADYDLLADGNDDSNFSSIGVTADDFLLGEDTIYDGIQYTVYPSSQRPDLEAFLIYKNLGLEQTESWITGNFNGASYDSEIDTVTAHSTNLTYIDGGFTTDGLEGDHVFEITASSTNEDATPDDNTLSKTINFSDYVYAKDNGVARNDYPGTDANGNSTQEFFRYGNNFRIYEDAMVYGIDVAVMNTSEEDVEVQAELFDFTEFYADADADAPAEPEVASEEIIVDPSNFSAFGEDVVWVSIAFEEPYNAVAGEMLCGAISSLDNGTDGAGLQIANGDNSLGATWSFVDNGTSGGIDWFNFIGSSTPLVRLNFTPDLVTNATSISEVASTDIQLGQNRPNPTTGETAITYTIDNRATVSFEITDILGKVVFSSNEGVKANGTYTLNFDASTLNAGMYTYSLTAGTSKFSKKMIVD